ALEKELGIQLFIRTKKGVVLTEAGKTSLSYAKRIVEEAEELRQIVAGRENDLVGTVRVAAATQALVHLFAPLFEDFMDSSPSVELLFRTTTSTEQTVANILEGVIDVGFASLAVYSPVLRVTELFTDELVLVVGRKHTLSSKKHALVDHLQQERWILFERGASIRRATDEFFKAIAVEPEKALESNDTYFIKLMIEHGLGISLLPSWAVREEVRNGKLATVRVDGHALNRAVSMVSLKAARSAPIKAFLEFMLSNKERIQEFALD
ncbi:MAG TPA: LysR substrate-binding domain-containing protein, partial [Pyrinomonadaceae bacterium]|nr:LysR substrate-binding domain-containing protein [Pyrinomonadaceae bacterium]